MDSLFKRLKYILGDAREFKGNASLMRGIKGVGDKKGKLFWRAMAQGIIWRVWKDKIRQVSEEVKLEWGAVRDAIIREVGAWMIISPRIP